MGYIYGGAQLTVVAGYGNDADAGLPGVSNIHRKRQQHSTQIGNFKLSTMPRNAFQALLDSSWYSRGWTFQELLFSKRILAFTEEQILFLCIKSSFRVDLVLEGSSGSVSVVQSLEGLLPHHISLAGHNF
jgi:heterokaryon incompatibility protein (HET)